jgi:hypothetical protein
LSILDTFDNILTEYSQLHYLSNEEKILQDFINYALKHFFKLLEGNPFLLLEVPLTIYLTTSTHPGKVFTSKRGSDCYKIKNWKEIKDKMVKLNSFAPIMLTLFKQAEAAGADHETDIEDQEELAQPEPHIEEAGNPDETPTEDSSNPLHNDDDLQRVMEEMGMEQAPQSQPQESDLDTDSKEPALDTLADNTAAAKSRKRKIHVDSDSDEESEAEKGIEEERNSSEHASGPPTPDIVEKVDGASHSGVITRDCEASFDNSGFLSDSEEDEVRE